MAELFALIDATEKGRLDKLTMHRMPGALPFAGKSRLIDFALSNCRHSGIVNVAVFPEGNYRSLQDHVGSGKRWHLDRRRDGLFILPPKHASRIHPDGVTLQRMHEHIEYFRRSAQSHVIIMPAHLVWNTDYNIFLDEHLASGADISEVIADERLGVFVLERDRLLDSIERYDTLPYRTIEDIVADAPAIKRHVIRHRGYIRKIDDVQSYYAANLDLLDEKVLEQVFRASSPVLSKEKASFPVRYGEEAEVEDSLIAAGSRIEGSVSNSVIGRNVVVEKGARLAYAVVMNDVVIERGADVRHAILDKQTLVRAGARLHGSEQAPYLTQKAQTLRMMTSRRIVHVGSECHPFAKTGGLADVIEGLARHSVRERHEVAVVMPCYQRVAEKFTDMRVVSEHVVEYGGIPHKTVLRHIRHHEVDVYFIDAFLYFGRERLYGYDDDCDRFAFFNVALAQILKTMPPFDIVHLHDWHTAMLAALLGQEENASKTVLTLHNVDYQGECPVSVAESCGVAVRNGETFNMLELGVQHADRLTTVSPTYRDELRHPDIGKNLTEPLIRREREFYGVLNGLSEAVGPARDALIPTPYTAETLNLKDENKRHLQRTMTLATEPDAFLIGSVGRIIEQKGFDIAIPALERLMDEHEDIQFVLLGDGDASIIERLRRLQGRHPKRVALNIGFEAAEPHLIYAGADLFLMPSRVEPCGLSQMIAMKYGTPPLVHHTGGLADTVTHYDDVTHHGTGFSFHAYAVDPLRYTLEGAYKLFKRDKSQWRALQRRAMEEDFSLDRQASKMLEIYDMML